MSRSMLPELRLIDETLRAAASVEAGTAQAEKLARQLEIGFAKAAPGAAEGGDRRAFYDFSGRVVIRTITGSSPVCDSTWMPSMLK